jgi:integrase
LSKYPAYLQNYSTISTLTLKQRVVAVKNFLEYHDVDMSPGKFKLKLKLPKVIRKSKETLSKEYIIDILNACSDIRLKTYVMLLTGSGMRATEALSIRIKDLDLTCGPAKENLLIQKLVNLVSKCTQSGAVGEPVSVT